METTIKERPMLFSAPMVRALLDGSKTQTRRVMKVPPKKDFSWDGGYAIISKAVSVAINIFNRAKGVPLMGDATPCPYGKPGDRLWVRETCQAAQDGMTFGVNYLADGSTKWLCRSMDTEWLTMYDYRGASGATIPSIHMPRWASRLNLEITSVRVERLNDISEADAKAEGCEPADCCHAYYHGFSKLWESINGAGSWEQNPWVWVIEFKRV